MLGGDHLLGVVAVGAGLSGLGLLAAQALDLQRPSSGS
jgi:hypothetical protein